VGLQADDPEFCRQTGIDETEVLVTKALQQTIGHLIRENEFDLHGHLARELEEMRGVQDAMASEPFDRSKHRPAVNSHTFRMLQKPFVEQLVSVPDVLVHIEAQVGAVHVIVPFRWVSVQAIRAAEPAPRSAARGAAFSGLLAGEGTGRIAPASAPGQDFEWGSDLCPRRSGAEDVGKKGAVC
jgi:hypothetical protein